MKKKLDGNSITIAKRIFLEFDNPGQKILLICKNDYNKTEIEYMLSNMLKSVGQQVLLLNLDANWNKKNYEKIFASKLNILATTYESPGLIDYRWDKIFELTPDSEPKSEPKSEPDPELDPLFVEWADANLTVGKHWRPDIYNKFVHDVPTLSITNTLFYRWIRLWAEVKNIHYRLIKTNGIRGINIKSNH